MPVRETMCVHGRAAGPPAPAGAGPPAPSQPCPARAGKGAVPTADGRRLPDFLRRHLT